MTGRSLRLVVADDDDLLRDMLSGLLGDLGYTVVAAVADGAAAVQASLEHRPDLVLLDHRMPVLTGIEAAGRLRDELPGLPIVILSAYDDAGLQRAAREAGATSYLVKGCTAAQIAEAIEVACDGSKVAGPRAPRPPATRPAPFHRAATPG